MKAFTQLPAVLVVATVMLAPPQVLAQTGKTPENIAEEVTVLILREKTIGKGIKMSGSGVIIGRKPEGKSYTYYVLTANHVVPTQNNYQVETKSGKKYPVDFNTVREISGGDCVDLAVLEFSSNKIYHPVNLEKSGNMSNDTPAYISGWVEGEQRKFSPGKLIDTDFITKVDSEDNSDCTSLAVGELTEDAVAPGMSGGPILNEKGNLIGIFVATRLFGPVRGTSIETFRDRASQELPDVLELADNPIDIPSGGTEKKPPKLSNSKQNKPERQVGGTWTDGIGKVVGMITKEAIVTIIVSLIVGFLIKNKK